MPGSHWRPELPLRPCDGYAVLHWLSLRDPRQRVLELLIVQDAIRRQQREQCGIGRLHHRPARREAPRGASVLT